MTLTLQLSQETERKIEALARQNGLEVEDFVRRLLESVSTQTDLEQESRASSDAPFPEPELVEKGGVHVVRAQALQNLADIVQSEREQRLKMVEGSLKA